MFMLLQRSLLVLGLVATLALGASAAEAGKGKKKGQHAVKGVVESVDRDADKDAGTITVKVHKKTKDAAANAVAEEKKFRVTAQTKFEKVRGKKGDRETVPATFADVRPGEHVAIVPESGEARTAAKVLIHGKGKKKNKANS
jgi:hypothetical protein